MLYNPGTTFEELRASAEYLLSPESPAVLKLIGMTVLRGTPEEQSLRCQQQGKEAGYTIRYRLADPRVAAFARLLGLYSPIYEPVAHDYYELHFMVGDLSPAEREAFLARIKPVEKSIQNLHRQFLSRALARLFPGEPRPARMAQRAQSGLRIFAPPDPATAHGRHGSDRRTRHIGSHTEAIIGEMILQSKEYLDRLSLSIQTRQVSCHTPDGEPACHQTLQLQV